MENLAMEVAELSAQVSRLQEEVSNARRQEAIKDVQDAQSSLSRATQILTDFYAKAGQTVSLTQQSLFSEVHSTWIQAYNGNQVRGTIVISFLQVIQSDFARLESETTAAESETVRTFDKFTGKAVNSGAGGHECHAGKLRVCPSPSCWEGPTVVCLSCER